MRYEHRKALRRKVRRAERSALMSFLKSIYALAVTVGISEAASSVKMHYGGEVRPEDLHRIVEPGDDVIRPYTG